MCDVGIITMARRMCKKAIQQGRSTRRGESYSCRTGKPLRFTTRGITRVTFVNAAEPVRRPCLARTPLADFFRILLKAGACTPRQIDPASESPFLRSLSDAPFRAHEIRLGPRARADVETVHRGTWHRSGTTRCAMSLTHEMDGFSIDRRKSLVFLDASLTIADGTILDMTRGVRASCHRQ